MVSLSTGVNKATRLAFGTCQFSCYRAGALAGLTGCAMFAFCCWFLVVLERAFVDKSDAFAFGAMSGLRVG